MQQRGRLVGYARVSTRDQETRLQLDALSRAGVQHVFQEKASGVSHRPVLRECLASMREGDVFVFWRLDRVARSLIDLLAIHDDLRSRGVALRSLTEPFDTTTPWGVCAFQTLGAFAQLERSTIRERVVAGQVAHISRGGRHGRPATLSAEDEVRVVAMWVAGESNKARIARAFGVGRHVVDRVVRLHENPSDSRYGPRRPVLGPLLQAAVK
ncbi:recombinase family protein [Acidovorax sp. SUPP3434]|uniref:recombinase family protein n=1 Tax=Acidovorax sp. SUPP3434 TaxID=2920880 RepID=UPI0024E06E52|nr:recombinase family protein [Acidovorax sp. SUPP3434]